MSDVQICLELEPIAYIFRQPVEQWEYRIKELLARISADFEKRMIVAVTLAKGVSLLYSDLECSVKKAQEWLRVWQDCTATLAEFERPLRFLKTAVEIRQAKDLQGKRLALWTNLCLIERELFVQVWPEEVNV